MPTELSQRKKHVPFLPPAARNGYEPENEPMGLLPMNTVEKQAIIDLMHSMGITENYIGFSQLLFAVQLAREDPRRLASVTKEIYPDVAKAYNTSWRCVERNIRTVIEVSWSVDPRRISDLANYPLHRRPKPAQFISLLLNHLP